MNVRAFVIHLQRAKQRRAQVDHIISSCPVKTQVIDAVDGSAMSEDERTRVYTSDKLFEPRYPFVIGAGEIGCFLSHRRAWQAIVDAGIDAGLVIEDDVEIDKEQFAAALRMAENHIETEDVIQFQVRNIEGPATTLAETGGLAVLRPMIVPLRLSCTMYSPRAAQRLLDLSTRFDRPVDGLMQMHWVTGLHPAIVVPSGVSDASADVGGTTIQAWDLNLLSRFRRELFRPVYRWQINRKSLRTGG